MFPHFWSSKAWEFIRWQVYHITGQPSNVFFQLVLISWMVTPSSCLVWQIISFSLPPKEYDCVYAWTTLGSGPEIDLQKMPILAFWYWRVCKQAKLLHLGHRKPASIHWKADAPKTSHYLAIQSSIGSEVEVIQCVTSSLSRPAIDLLKMPILIKKKVIFSDGAQFDLGWNVNKQNCCIWGTENPNADIEKPPQPKWVTVWCGF